MSDGGITGIAWYGLDLPAETPTIIVMHTLTGTPVMTSDLHRHTGWRELCLRRPPISHPDPKFLYFN